MKSEARKNETPALKYARQSLLLMTERNIEPTPINYTVWYHYTMGDIKELNAEIDKFLRTKTLVITDDVNIYLYNKYVLAPQQTEEEAVTDTSQNAQTVLGEIMEVIKKFSSDTENYNTQIDSHVTALSKKITDPALKEMAAEIINRAVAIRDSGSELSSKLEESKREVAVLKTNLERVTYESHRDFLTGVGNRKALEKRLEELTRWSRENNNADLCLLMIDIDHFKSFNDKFGHLIGDEVLKKVGQALVDTVKGKDFVGRYGGEEFAILLPSTPLAGALVVGENIRKNIEETILQRKDTGDVIDKVTVSIGVARYRPDQDSAAVFISRADNALYRAKMGGRNRVTPESFN
ncbi:MAG TPA: diguanylate cyclase [Rickettsiales bacterium]|nr:diguanylate cyclase [Rickettsiales bacterium]